MCSGAVSFSEANDQDGVSNVNNPNQATPLRVSYVAIYDVAWTASQKAAHIAQQCHTTDNTSLWGAWYGDSAVDRSGQGRPAARMSAATLAAQSSSAATGMTNICPPPSLPMAPSLAQRSTLDLSTLDLRPLDQVGYNSFFEQPPFSICTKNGANFLLPRFLQGSLKTVQIPAWFSIAPVF